MKYKPGSFTKNFGWETAGRGLVKLHEAIKFGFNSSIKAVSRDSWRANCGIEDSARQLIPLNFFLHNHIVRRADQVSADELVRVAINEPHSRKFDLLALFALNLNEAGQRTNGGKDAQHPASWINEAVRDVLWRADAWQAYGGSNRLRTALEDRVLAEGDDTAPKCATNYLRILELCGFSKRATGPLNTSPIRILPSAYFLAWDRLILDGSLSTLRPNDFIEPLRSREVHKLLGTSWEFVEETAAEAIQLYPGQQTGKSPPKKKTGASNPPGITPPFGGLDEALQAQTGLDRQIERRLRTALAQVRDRKIVSALKIAYNNRCMFCGETLCVATDPLRHYSEAAHIKPLGTPHNGPDHTSNILILCPNHHIQFDQGILRIRSVGQKLVIESLDVKSPLHRRALKLHPGHKVDSAFFEYHRSWHDDD
ncbi:MAG: HNH endonuclease [Hyphomicrobium sp.]|nr:HNH endonuclease [Hyphomicrobium sp.]